MKWLKGLVHLHSNFLYFCVDDITTVSTS